MRKMIAKKVLSIMMIGVLAFGSVATVSLVTTPTAYAASKTSTTKQVKSLRKSIKSYNTKTQAIAKRTSAAKKYATSTKSYYKKSLKTKKVKTLKSYKAKASTAYKNAQIVDYRAQIKTAYNSVNSIYKSHPGAKSRYTKAKSLYDKSKKTKSVSTLKSQTKQVKDQLAVAKSLKSEADKVTKINNEIVAISKDAPSMATYVTRSADLVRKAKSGTTQAAIKAFYNQALALQTDAKSHMTTLTWYPAEYRSEWVEGYDKTVVVQKAEYRWMQVSYFVWVAKDAGYVTGGDNWDVDWRIANNRVFPYSTDKEQMKAWGCVWYMDENDQIVRIMTSAEKIAYADQLLDKGISDQSRETAELFLIKPEITEQQKVDGYYKQVLVRAAGWY